ncbi:hypothetical protein GUITHDRAFT_66714 [Guillardia theta CCMP2712]|uniref:Guanylate cyclase domain-containing protein n=1 Tax=Guillardia theta (strain CCMP2712) TaxID=905079 RepID=L1JR41_GUITC|nr:hypothetical protein GUITHDRAFT_66714 [Guillardia theta CCMP2712]EKX50660.1 hypothetical protein GUITHDRAFT_66714 [Guillardia theta CCMP2712]|eukprot:XP_005837640.1 hypothetical protein GUITHDRAFT_66714 [Guillardia theta CCMP2712]
MAGSVVISTLLLLLLLSHKQYSKLLYRIMPRHVVHRLQNGQQVVEVFDDVTVFFSDIVGFTDLAGQSSPLEVVALLNDLYTKFDNLVDKHGVCKVDTIGDAYMVVGGAPDRCEPSEAAAKVAKFALDALEEMTRSGHAISMRAGMASGPVVAGVLGTSVPKYSIFGDTVNTASRMESTGKAGLLQATEHTRDLLLESSSRFEIEERVHANGQKGIMVKGKGIMNTFWVRSVSEGS